MKLQFTKLRKVMGIQVIPAMMTCSSHLAQAQVKVVASPVLLQRIKYWMDREAEAPTRSYCKTLVPVLKLQTSENLLMQVVLPVYMQYRRKMMPI